MENIKERVGGVNVRVGGSSSDFASLGETLGSGQTEAVLYGSAIPVSLIFIFCDITFDKHCSRH